MAILNEDYGEGISESKRAEVCKPDYENLIKTAKEKMRKAEALRDAIFEYKGERSRKSDVLSTMVGELCFEIRGLSAATERLIEQQENEK